MTVLELCLIAVIVVLLILLIGFWRAKEWRTLDGMWSLTQPVSGLDDAHILIDSGKATVLTNQEGDVETNTGAVKTRTNWTPWHQKTVRGELTLPANLLGTRTWSYEKTPLGELTLRAPKKKVLVFVRDALASLA